MSSQSQPPLPGNLPGNLPGTTIDLQTGQVTQINILTSLQPLLEQARAEHALRHFREAQDILNRVIAEATRCVESAATPPDIRSGFDLLLASANCLIGRSLRSSGNERDGIPRFAVAVELFRRRQADIDGQRNDVRLHADYGIALYRAGDTVREAALMEAAIEELERAVGSRAAPAEAFNYLGLCYQYFKKFDEAEAALRLGLQSNPGDPGIYRCLAEVLAASGNPSGAVQCYLDAALGVTRLGENDFASFLLSAALKLEPANPEVVNLAVAVYRAQQKFDTAFEVVEAALQERPEAVSLQALKGRLLHDVGRLAEAITQLSAIPVNAQDRAWIGNELAATLYAAQKTIEARDVLENLLKYAPDDPTALLLLGQILLRQDLPNEAMPVLRKALANGSQPAPTLRELGYAQLSLHQNEPALASFEAVLAAEPESRYAIWGKAQALVRLQKAEAAVPELRRLLRLDPCNRDALGMLFDALIRLGRSDDAMHEFLSEIQRNPECAVAWYFKGSLLLNQGDHPAAIEALNTSTRIDPKNGDAWVTLMNAHRLQGNYGAAGLACAEASKLDNLSGFALGWLGIYNAEIGEFARASENLRRAVADDEKQSWLWASLGWALQYRGDADCGAASLEAYRKGLSVCQEIAGTTDEVWLHKGLADALFLAGQPGEATQEFENIARICSGRRDHNELYILAWSYYLPPEALR